MHNNRATKTFRHRKCKTALGTILRVYGAGYTFIGELGDYLPSVRFCGDLDSGKLASYRQALVVRTHPSVSHYLLHSAASLSSVGSTITYR
ncbi:hypothetical protein D3C77_622750 [compost metagenome]